jgi:hypothetical protein
MPDIWASKSLVPIRHQAAAEEGQEEGGCGGRQEEEIRQIRFQGEQRYQVFLSQFL